MALKKRNKDTHRKWINAVLAEKEVCFLVSFEHFKPPAKSKTI